MYVAKPVPPTHDTQVSLDRTYTFLDTKSPLTRADYKIIGDSIHSNHLPMWLRVWLESKKKR